MLESVQPEEIILMEQAYKHHDSIASLEQKEEKQEKPSKLSLLQVLKKKAKEMKRDVFALYLAYQHPGVPWYVKALAIFIVAYAFSPIDLIPGFSSRPLMIEQVPDFIPIIGYLDDLIIVPLGIWICIKLIPPEIMEECRNKAELMIKNKNTKGSKICAGVIIAIWILGLWFCVKWFFFSNVE